MEDRGVVAWLAAVIVILSPQHHLALRTSGHQHFHPKTPLTITRRVFGAKWRAAWCVSFYESRHQLDARNGSNLGPWQINIVAHPWANPWLLTHSWRYSARAAYRISHRGRDWSAWTTHSLCGL